MADGFFTCGITPLGVSIPVFNQVNLMNDRVDQTLTATLNLANELASYQVANLSFSIDPTTPQQYTIRDLADDVTFTDVEFRDLGTLPSIGPANAPTLADPPTPPDAPADAPEPVIPNTPVAYNPVFGPTPTIVFPVAPTYGDLTSGIPFPDLREIVLPDPPDVDFGIPFTAQPPVFDVTPPDPNDFTYTDPGYSPLLVDEIKATIQAMLAGTTGLPRVVEDALWAREAEREAENAASAVQDAFEEMAVRGFAFPNGPLQSKLQEVRQNNQNKANSLGRDTMIRIHEVLVDQLKFGVSSGLQLETTWITLYNEVQNRRLQAAQIGAQIAIAVYNARVEQYKAAAQVYQIEAEVYKTRIEAELAKLQAYSEEIKAQSLIQEINKLDVEIYTARLDAIKVNVDVYLAEIQAYTALTNAERLKLDVFKTQIETELAKLQAVQLEVQIWQGEIQGQQLIQEAIKTRTQTYLAKLEGWKTQFEAKVEQQRGAIAALEADTARFVAQMQGITAVANYEVARGQAIVADNASKVQRFSAAATFTSAFNSALAEKIKMVNDINVQNKELALKNGEINAQNGLAVAQLLEQAIAQATQVLAQITASFASSVNMHASVSDSTSFGQSCNYNTSQSLS